MNGIIPRIREWLFGTPEDAAPPAAPPSPRQLRGTYDLARTDSSNSKQWRGADWLDADASDSPGVRQVLRNRSRHEVQNNPTLTGICRTVCDYEIGTGPTLHVDNDDEDFAAKVEEKWRDWCEAVNLVGKLRQMVYGRVVDGEGFARIGQNPNLKNDVQLDVQPFECDRCYTLWLPYLTPYRIDGIWFDVWGNPTYYDVLQYHPGGVFPMPTWKFDTTPAQFVLHLFNSERANQHRGIPEMMSSTDLWADRRRHRKATVAAAESAANVAAFLTTNQPPEYGGDMPSGKMEMPRNSIVVAPDGYDMRQIDAKHPNQTYEMFSTETLSEAARPMSMAKNVAKCDSSSYNFAGGRLDIITSWKAVEGNQSNNTWRVVNPLFRAWYVEARIVYGWQAKDSGTIPAHHFLWVGMPYSDPEAEQNADEAAIRTGLKGIQEVYARRGKDWRVQRKMNAKALGMSDDEYMDFVVDNFRAGKDSAAKEPAEPGEAPPQSGETPEAVKAKFARLFPGLAKRLNGHLKAAGWDESKHPRGQPGNPGEFGPGGSSGGTATKTAPAKKTSKPTTEKEAAEEDREGEEEESEPAKRPAVAKGQSAAAHREGKGKDAKIVMEDGSEAPAHITPAMIPPAWKNVQIFTDPDSEVWVKATMPGKNGKKDAGKGVYKPSYEAEMAAAKFARKNAMQAEIKEIDSKIHSDRANPKKKDAADVAFLMREQATRPGSEADTKGVAKHYGKPVTADDFIVTAPKGKGPAKVALKVGEETIPVKDQGTADEIQRRIKAGESLEDSTFWLKSHGATTLEGRHVVESPDGVRLQFVGKEGVWHDHLIANPQLASMLLARKESAGDAGKLFGVNDTKAAAYVKTLDHGRLTPKDLRTNRANEIAAEEAGKFDGPPKDSDEGQARKMAVATTVSKKLGNQPEMCIERYIDPSTWLHPAFTSAGAA